MTTIAILNKSTISTDLELQAIAAAIQKQVTSDFGPIWNAYADIVFIPKGALPPKGAWQVAILDDADTSDALGYHDLTSEGLPLGKVFAKADKDAGSSLSVTISHETLEMLGDPWVMSTVVVPVRHGGLNIYALENADACEDDSLGYQIDGILVSDFVYPSWFRPSAEGPYDHCGHINKPLEILAGGYIGVLHGSAQGGWTQINARGEPHETANETHSGSRRGKRTRGHEAFELSEI